MTQIVDASGLSCPQPVLLTKRALEAGDLLVEVIVDSVASRENVRRLAESRGYRVKVDNREDGFRLTIEE